MLHVRVWIKIVSSFGCYTSVVFWGAFRMLHRCCKVLHLVASRLHWVASMLHCVAGCSTGVVGCNTSVALLGEAANRKCWWLRELERFLAVC